MAVNFVRISFAIYLIAIFNMHSLDCNPDAKRLYDDLLSSYNRLIRPVYNNSDTLTVKMALKLSQLIDVNLKNQIMTTNVWVLQEWIDHKLKWDPEEYGGVSQLYVPAEQIWLPDIVLYNNADGNYEVTIMTKAVIVSIGRLNPYLPLITWIPAQHDSGRVIWNPPAIYKSSCNIDINYFPFDQQECLMKFGSWTYDGFQVDLKHLFDPIESPNESRIDLGMDLSEFYLNVEWDIMKVPAMKRIKRYACCPEPYPDITFNITLRRKTLFYTVNLIIPCVGISCLSVLVFYLPSDSGEKVTLSVSIMLSLTFFFLVLIETIPSTSLAMPLLGKYLVFTMVLVTFSVIVTILVLNIHFRSPSTHRMAPWVRKTFIRILPKILLMRPPQYKLETHSEVETANGNAKSEMSTLLGPNACANCAPNRADQYFKCAKMRALVPQQTLFTTSGSGEQLIIQDLDVSPIIPIFEPVSNYYPKEVDQVINNAIFIAHHIDNADEFKSIQEDWKYVAMVLDRLFLWIFTLACVVGTGTILLIAPSIYDTTTPIDIVHSKIANRQFTILDTD